MGVEGCWAITNVGDSRSDAKSFFMNSLSITATNSQGLSDWMLNRCGRVLEVFYPCMPGEGQTLVADPEERLWRKDDNLKNVFHLNIEQKSPTGCYRNRASGMGLSCATFMSTPIFRLQISICGRISRAWNLRSILSRTRNVLSPETVTRDRESQGPSRVPFPFLIGVPMLPCSITPQSDCPRVAIGEGLSA